MDRVNNRETTLDHILPHIQLSPYAAGLEEDFYAAANRQTPITPLLQSEHDLLSEMETLVTKGFRGVFQMGYAWREIQRRQLFRAEYTSFHAYITRRWEVSIRAAYKMMESYSVLETLMADTRYETDEMYRATVDAMKPTPLRFLSGFPPDTRRTIFLMAYSDARNLRATSSKRISGTNLEAAANSLFALLAEKKRTLGESTSCLTQLARDEDIHLGKGAMDALDGVEKDLVKHGFLAPSRNDSRSLAVKSGKVRPTPMADKHNNSSPELSAAMPQEEEEEEETTRTGTNTFRVSESHILLADAILELVHSPDSPFPTFILKSLTKVPYNKEEKPSRMNNKDNHETTELAETDLSAILITLLHQPVRISIKLLHPPKV